MAREKEPDSLFRWAIPPSFDSAGDPYSLDSVDEAQDAVSRFFGFSLVSWSDWSRKALLSVQGKYIQNLLSCMIFLLPSSVFAWKSRDFNRLFTLQDNAIECV